MGYFIHIKTNDRRIYGATLKALGDEIGISRNTLRNWLKRPENGIKKGFWITDCEYIKSKQGGKR